MFSIVPILSLAVSLQGAIMSSLTDRMKAEFRLTTNQDPLTKDDPTPGGFWTARLTPPFPEHWPPTTKTRLVYYSYAWSFKGLRDAERQSQLWGKFLVSPKNSGLVHFERLRETYSEIGIQGLLSVDPANVKEADSTDELIKVIDGTLDPDSSKAIKSYYCRWSDQNSVISNQALRFHEKFHEWLGSLAKKVKAGPGKT